MKVIRLMTLSKGYVVTRKKKYLFILLSVLLSQDFLGISIFTSIFTIYSIAIDIINTNYFFLFVLFISNLVKSYLSL